MRGAERLRYAGLAATALLAAGAYGAGALPGGDPAPDFASSFLSGTGTGYKIGLLTWVCGLALLAAAWWRLLGRLGEVSPRWLLVTAALWAAPLLLAPPLASRDAYAYACQGALWADGQDPYATGVGPAGCPWLEAVPPLWHETPTPYGPLAVALSGGAAAIARALPVGAQGQLLVAVTVLRLLAVAGVALAAGCALRLARRRCPDGGPAAAWLAALSPVVLVHAVSGAHNDAVLAGLVVAALAVAASEGGAAHGAPRPEESHQGAGWRRVLAVGALLGLAAAVKVTAVVAAPFAVLLLAGPRGENGSSTETSSRAEAGTLRNATGVLGGMVGAFAVCTVATGLNLGWVGALQGTGSLVQWTSVPTAVGMALGYPLRALGWAGGYPAAVALARAAGILALALAYAALIRASWRARGAARPVLLACGAAFALLAALSPVFYPWYALTPLAVFAAAPTSLRVRRWLAGAAIGLSALVLPQGLGIAVVTKLPGAYLVTGAVAATAWYLWRRRRPASRSTA